jgi:hypothetical protein
VPAEVSVYRVDDYGGTDSERLAAACTAALKAIPATVELPARQLMLTRYQNVRLGVSVQGVAGSGLFLDYPGATAPAGNSPYGLNVAGAAGHPTVLAGFSIRARPTGYYRLLTGLNANGVELRDLTFGVCGQSFVELRGCTNVGIYDCEGAYGGDNSYDKASAKYKIAIVNCANVDMAGLELGDPTHDRNQSFVTINASANVTVRESRFYGTRTYCLNTHGTGSTGVLFENNHLEPGPNAHYGAVLVGNEAYGPDLDVTIRGNTMQGPGRFLQLRAGSGAWLEGNIVPAGNELVGGGPGGGTAHLKV